MRWDTVSDCTVTFKYLVSIHYVDFKMFCFVIIIKISAQVEQLEFWLVHQHIESDVLSPGSELGVSTGWLDASLTTKDAQAQASINTRDASGKAKCLKDWQ